MTAAKLATSLRSVSAASASAARAVATSATACLQVPELMPLLPGNCCPAFRQNTCKCQSFVSAIFFWQNSSLLIVSQGNEGHHKIGFP